MGPQNYPSPAQIRIAPWGTTGPIEIQAPGFRPYDGFGCYPAFDYNQCRWGDYSASVATPDGTVYSATEWIGDNSRTYLENWSTFIWPTSPVVTGTRPAGRRREGGRETGPLLRGWAAWT